MGLIYTVTPQAHSLTKIANLKYSVAVCYSVIVLQRYNYDTQKIIIATWNTIEPIYCFTR